MQFIDLKTQYKRLEEKIQQRMQFVLEHGQYIMGPEVQELETTLAEYIGVNHCIGLANGTDALLIALMALGIKAGDEVITSPFTFIANAEMILLLGATPIFIDIDPKTYNLDPNLIEKAITKKTKAILPISLYGQCADMDAINVIANKHDLAVIEDAAQSFGATYKNKKSCGLSTIATTSFFPSKPLGAYGDAGACFTNDDDLALKIKQIRIHGQSKRYYHQILGMNGRLDTLQAAILLAKFEIFPEEIVDRQKNAKTYNDLLEKHVTIPYIESYNTCVYAQYTIQTDYRDQLQKHLAAQNIPTAIHYPIPLHLQPVLAGYGYQEGDFPVAENLAKRVISLPMSPYLTSSQIHEVAQAVVSCIQK